MLAASASRSQSSSASCRTTVAAVKDGRSVVIDGDLAAAYSLGTTLALDYAVDQMVPRLAKAVA